MYSRSERYIAEQFNLLVGSNSAYKDYIVETKEKSNTGIHWALFNVKTWIIYPQ